MTWNSRVGHAVARACCVVLAVLTTRAAEADGNPAPARAAEQPDDNAIYEVALGNAARTGPADALVTMVVFADFECPFSARVQDTLSVLKAVYKEDLRIVFRHNPLPFHRNAALAAEASLAAREQGKFWEYHDLLFAHQTALGREQLEAYAEQLGLDVAAFRSALDLRVHRREVEADQAFVRGLDFAGTPTFFINGRNLRGAQPIEAFVVTIDEERTRAKALAAKGTARTALYEQLVAGGAKQALYVKGVPTPVVVDPDHLRAFGPTSAAPRRGGRAAKVVIQELADFQCPFSARAQSTVDRVVEEYGDKVEIVWRNLPLPFHRDAELAAEAAMEVFDQKGSAAFWAYHDLLFENQRALAKDDLIRYASAIDGIDTAKLARALKSRRHRARVASDMKVAADAISVRVGAPTFIINHHVLQGAHPFEKFREAIDAELSGTPLPPSTVVRPLAAPANEERTRKMGRVDRRQLYERACKAGLPAGCYYHALRYMNDDGVSQNPAATRRLFDRACKAGYGAACTSLAFTGVGAKGELKDPGQFAARVQRACELGDARGCYLLSDVYRAGEGVERDQKKADRLQVQACEMGDSDACSAPLGHSSPLLPGILPEPTPGTFQLRPPSL